MQHAEKLHLSPLCRIHLHIHAEGCYSASSAYLRRKEAISMPKRRELRDMVWDQVEPRMILRPVLRPSPAAAWCMGRIGEIGREGGQDTKREPFVCEQLGQQCVVCIA
jgi:hypothetical protein